MAALLEEVVGVSIANHPDIRLGAEFVRCELLRRLRPDSDAALQLRTLHAADVYLAAACAAGDPAALARASALLEAQMEIAARRLRVRPSAADDAHQQLRERLFVGDATRGPAIADFAGSGSLAGFLRVAAMRACLRAKQREKREVMLDADDLDALAPAVDPVLERLKHTYRQHFAESFAAALASLSPRDRTLLRYSVVDRLSIDQIGALYRVHRATAARWLERIRAQIGQATEEQLSARLSLTKAELVSVMRLRPSRIELSLSRLLSGTS